MPDPLRLAIVGCGGMGRRHLAGLAELSGTEHRNVELVAVCDPNRANAEFLAGEAERLLGARPAVFGDAGVLEHAPSYRLDPVAATLFGGEGPPSYDLDFAVVDRKLIALEWSTRCSSPIAWAGR